MRSIIQAIIIVCCCIPTTLIARNKRVKHSMPIREIDRPLLLPQRQSKLSSGYTASFRWDKDDGLQEVALGDFPNNDGENIWTSEYYENPTLIIPEYRYGFNDSLQLSLGLSDFPTLHFLCLNNSVLENGVVSIAKPTLAAFIGINSLYSDADGVRFDMHGGLEGKFPINNRLWSYAELKFIAGNSPFLDFEYTADLGIQLSNMFAIIPQIKLYQHVDLSDQKNSIHGKFRTILDLNISDHYSMDIYGVVEEDFEYTLIGSAGFTMNFHW